MFPGLLQPIQFESEVNEVEMISMDCIEEEINSIFFFSFYAHWGTIEFETKLLCYLAIPANAIKYLNFY